MSAISVPEHPASFFYPWTPPACLRWALPGRSTASPTTGRRCALNSARSASFFLQPSPSLQPSGYFKARYRGLGPTRKLAENRSGTLEYFLTERYNLFTSNRFGQPMRASIHHVPWPLEEAEAEIEQNDARRCGGIRLPDVPPVLHYSRRLAVYVWQLEQLQPAPSARRIPAEAVPSI